MTPLRILHLINDLDVGGAEMMLYKLLAHTDRSRFQSEVVSLIPIGAIGEKILDLGVPVRSLDMHRGLPNPHAVLRLARWLRARPPDLIQTWMYHADLIGGIAAKLAGRIPVAWGIRQTDLSAEGCRRRTRLTVSACARTSKWLPDRIVCCSHSVRDVHARVGYAAEKMVVIPNGLDLTTFRPDAAARLSVRKELGLPPDACLVGLMSRFHPQKDHHNFVRAAGLLHRTRPQVRFLLCGEEVIGTNPLLARWIEESGLRDVAHLLGRRDDMPRLTASLDLACSSSFGEGFPNAVGEAMACEVPCVVTDVGDSAVIVGETGRVVPKKDPAAMATALEHLLDLSIEQRRALGRRGRRRIEERYDLPAVVRRYESLYLSMASKDRALSAA